MCVHVRLGDVQVGIGRAAQEDVEVEVARPGPGPLEVEQRRDLVVVPQHVLEGDVAVDEGLGLERDDRRGQPRHQVPRLDEQDGIDVLELGRPRRRASMTGRVGSAAPTSRSCGACSIGGRSAGAGVLWRAASRSARPCTARSRCSTRERRPHVGEGPSGQALLDQPVLAATAAVGDDPGVADLGREDLGDQRLAVEAVVGMPVDPDGVRGGEPHLVGDAAGPLELDRGVEARAAERRARADLGERPPGLARSPWS